MKRLLALPILAVGLTFNLAVAHPQPVPTQTADAVAYAPSIGLWHSQNYPMVAVPAPKPKPKSKPVVKPSPKPRPTTRRVQSSRSEDRPAVRHVEVSHGSPKAYAASLVGSQFQCLNLLWERESGWNSSASNPSSGAYGIPQALPGSKMASAGSDWRTNPDTQIRWGIRYIESRYGSPCAAWAHSNSHGWY